MKLKDYHIQMGEDELTNAKSLLQDIENRSSGEIVSENDSLYISIISSGLIMWLDGFIKQIKLRKETEKSDIHV